VTGGVRVLNIWRPMSGKVSSHECGGRSKGVQMGLGFALTEEIVGKKGNTDLLSLITTVTAMDMRRSSPLRGSAEPWSFVLGYW